MADYTHCRTKPSHSFIQLTRSCASYGHIIPANFHFSSAHLTSCCSLLHFPCLALESRHRHKISNANKQHYLFHGHKKMPCSKFDSQALSGTYFNCVWMLFEQPLGISTRIEWHQGVLAQIIVTSLNSVALHRKNQCSPATATSECGWCRSPGWQINHDIKVHSSWRRPSQKLPVQDHL